MTWSRGASGQAAARIRVCSGRCHRCGWRRAAGTVGGRTCGTTTSASARPARRPSTDLACGAPRPPTVPLPPAPAAPRTRRRPANVGPSPPASPSAGRSVPPPRRPQTSGTSSAAFSRPGCSCVPGSAPARPARSLATRSPCPPTPPPRAARSGTALPPRRRRPPPAANGAARQPRHGGRHRMARPTRRHLATGTAGKDFQPTERARHSGSWTICSRHSALDQRSRPGYHATRTRGSGRR